MPNNGGNVSAREKGVFIRIAANMVIQFENEMGPLTPDQLKGIIEQAFAPDTPPADAIRLVIEAVNLKKKMSQAQCG